mmetsp:Transcript_18101/g.41062  ORF Transcript_18101/g.41062 Transcript_18101/m.41062 type:complete len:106 (-) Transcript_18101:64-381(-)
MPPAPVSCECLLVTFAQKAPTLQQFTVGFAFLKTHNSLIRPRVWRHSLVLRQGEVRGDGNNSWCSFTSQCLQPIAVSLTPAESCHPLLEWKMKTRSGDVNVYIGQ